MQRYSVLIRLILCCCALVVCAFGDAGATVVARSATVAKVPTVAARAATTQKVVGSGTKVASATENTVADETCQAKYNGCMDTFCLVDNEAGGRCICNNKIFDLDKIQSEIDAQDLQSYKLATAGVEAVGADGEAATVSGRGRKSGRVLDLWDVNQVDAESENERGARLMATAHEFCVAQISGCESEISMLQLMYGQQTKSDCAAYENALKQQKQQSQQKYDTANRAVRSAALDRLRTTNKYDLGQCTVEFKKCMQTTGGCGDDFSGCARIAAIDTTNVRHVTTRKPQNYQIKGVATNIEISASTYEMLMAKKPLCESITKSCVNVADQVWDTFLRDVAPQVKNAELIAEDKARQDCIGNISSCFQKACKDNVDPRDPDGSYDMCLTRPGAMLNFCKPELSACGVDASSPAAAEKSSIWDYVLARLAAMRVNSCTTEVKECLQSEDRCGKDYSQCVGLDTDTIIRMCPYDKLTGCQKVYGDADIRGDAVYDELAYLVRGLMVNIDNAMLEQCQAAVDEAMIRVCGTTENCNNMTVGENNIGARALEYKICEYSLTEDEFIINWDACRTDVSQITDKDLGRVEGTLTGETGPITPLMTTMEGMMFWGAIQVKDDGTITTAEEYIAKMEEDGTQMPERAKLRVVDELEILERNINSTISMIEDDPTVQYCMTGRRVQGMRDLGFGRQVPRFPNLTKQTRMIIANYALDVARENYGAKYDRLNEQMMQDYVTIAERSADIRGENAKDVRREYARKACVSMAQLSSLPKSPNPPKSMVGSILVGVAVIVAAVVITVVTWGTGAGPAAWLVGAWAASIKAGAVAASTLTMTTLSLAVAGGIAAAGAVATGISAGVNAIASEGANGRNVAMEVDMAGHYEMNQWNYKQVIDTVFSWETLNCHKCVVSTNCLEIKNPMFGSKSCKRWGEEEEECTDIQF